MLKAMTKSEEPFLIGYARVSTDDQDLSLQVKALEAYGVPTERIIKEYASGGTMNRPQWQTIMHGIRAGDVVVVWKLDRLGRTLRGIIETIEAMAERGVEVVSLTEQVDTKTAIGKAFYQIAGVFAELERNLISERTKAGMAVKAAQGVKFGQPHRIRDSEKRLSAYRDLVESGQDRTLTQREVLDVLNAADTSMPAIKSVNTLGNWLRAGCPGLE